MVSIIVPTHNAEKYIERTIDSILNQSYSDIEIIFADDASEDSTVEILRTYQQKDNRINIIISPTQSGVSYSRLSGVRCAHGEWIMFVDDDDTLPKYSVELLLNFDNSKRDIISGTIAIDSKFIPQYHLDGDLTPVEYIEGLLLSSTYNGPCAKIIRASLFDKEIEIPQTILLNEDILMMAEITLNARGVFISSDLPVYNYITRPDSQSKTKRQNTESWLLLFEYLKSSISQFHCDSLNNALAYFIIHRIFHFLIQYGEFVSLKNPQILSIVEYTSHHTISKDGLRMVKCIESLPLQYFEHIKFLILNSIKLLCKFIISRFTIFGKNYILKYLY